MIREEEEEQYLLASFEETMLVRRSVAFSIQTAGAAALLVLFSLGGVAYVMYDIYSCIHYIGRFNFFWSAAAASLAALGLISLGCSMWAGIQCFMNQLKMRKFRLDAHVTKFVKKVRSTICEKVGSRVNCKDQ